MEELCFPEPLNPQRGRQGMVLVENGSKGTWRESGLVLGILRCHGEALDLTLESRGGFEQGSSSAQLLQGGCADEGGGVPRTL